MPHNKIEIRSEEVQEILGFIPRWIIRWGITLIFISIFIILIGSWLFKYPDVINSQIIITTENPPASVLARSTGKIQHLFVKNNQQVDSGDYLAIIENSANYNEVFELQSQLKIFKLINTKTKNKFEFKQYYSLGDLQSSYSNFLKIHSDYQYFKEINSCNIKVMEINKQIKMTNIYFDRLFEQKNILEKEFILSQKQYSRDSALHYKKIITKSELEKSESFLLQKKYSFEVAKTTLTNTKIRIMELEQAITNLKIEYSEQKKQYELSLNEAYNNLTSKIKQWEQNYLLRTPISGKITFTTYWSINQNVGANDKVMTVIPNEESKIIGKLMFSAKGSGKVKAGQSVNIKFDSYPYMEYGMVKGIIETVSLISDNNFYTAEVSLPNGLKTSYGIKLKFGQEMQGTAEVITEDIRLLIRFLNPLKTLLKNNLTINYQQKNPSKI